MRASRKKTVSLKEFVRENESKFSGRYPFLTAKQITAKLKQCWKMQSRKEKDKNIMDKSPIHRVKPIRCSPKKCTSRSSTSPQKQQKGNLLQTRCSRALKSVSTSQFLFFTITKDHCYEMSK